MPSSKIEIPENTISKWQTIADIVAKLIDVPAALIMRLVESDIEVFVSSSSQGNPYHPGDHEHFLGSGLYCETVINSKGKLLVPNALKDEKWKKNPDIKLNMISYLGFPIVLPDQQLFGTICVLDNKENAYSKTFEEMIQNFRDIIQFHLELIYMNQVLGEKNKKLTDYIKEIKVLRGIVPICSFCKKIRDPEGNWNKLEVYLSRYSDAQLSHSYCSDCAQEHYSQFMKTAKKTDS